MKNIALFDYSRLIEHFTRLQRFLIALSIAIALHLSLLLAHPAASPNGYAIVLFSQNLLPLLAIFLSVWLLCGKYFASLLASISFEYLLLAANYLKQEHLDQSLMAVDLVSALNVGTHMELLSNYLDSSTHVIIILGVLMTTSLLCFLFEKSLNVFKYHWRFLGIFLLGFGLSSTTGVKILNWAYQPVERWKPWEPTKNTDKYGLVYCLIYDFFIVASKSPAYSAPDLNRILANSQTRMFAQDNSLPDAENIIVILSESFFDPSLLNGIEPEEFDIRGYTELKNKSLAGQMTVPTYGGATLRTEFELLTGISLHLFPKHRYPFISLITSPLNSLAWDFKDSGYSTVGIHANKASFWNRGMVYPLMGFDRLLDIKSFKGASRSGYYIQDDALTEKILSVLNDGEKQFIFSLSIENHGPWKKSRPNIDTEKVANIQVPNALSADNKIALQQYLYHQQAAEKAFMELIEHVDRQSSRSIVLFFGDHLPALYGVYNELGFVNGKSGPNQTLPYLIYDTHRNLNSDVGVNSIAGNSVIDVELLGSMLVDLSLKTPPVFHIQAEALHFASFTPDSARSQQAKDDLKQLQLWRFLEQNSQSIRPNPTNETISHPNL